MGYASYLEDIVERAIEHAPSRLPQPRPMAPGPLAGVSSARQPIFTRRVVTKSPLMPDAATVAQRTRDLRAIHLLCLSEMRPKYQASLHS
jgi:hypothetical protein